MHSRRIGLVVLAVLSLVGLHPVQAELRVGVATAKITPPGGTPMAGYYYARGSAEVLDDLYAKAAVLDDGRTKVVLVVCDLISLPRGTVLDTRQLVEKQTG
ncbi:MAG: hypothetical protein MUC88_25985, partial [Planctomycetes bacterium]|nr:hypothetical protein [Planctomycetota bacterium]